MKTRLNKKIYSKNGIMESISAFAHFCKITMKTEGGYYALSFSEIDDSVKESIIDEFNNFALYRSIAGNKSW